MTYEEIQGDLFFSLRNNEKFSKVECYCHCIANDGKYGKGIAPIFIDEIFKSNYWLKDYLATRPWDGHGKAVVSQDYDYYNRPIVYECHLITKESTYGKPTYETLKESLVDLKSYIIKNNESSIYKIDTLKMPKIGCGLDKLDWDKVSSIIKEVFFNVNIDIKVYYL
jgi:O-acetyl-ADP-ribose deacetylase (regulator of RNase III)